MKWALPERPAEIEQGFVVVDIRHGKHPKVSAVAPDGRTMLIVVSNTPSDWRVAWKFRAQLKRSARPTEVLRTRASAEAKAAHPTP
jgi:hypothetical protein